MPCSFGVALYCLPSPTTMKKASTWWKQINSAYYRRFLSYSLHVLPLSGAYLAQTWHVTCLFPQKEETYLFSFLLKEGCCCLAGPRTLRVSRAWRTRPLAERKVLSECQSAPCPEHRRDVVCCPQGSQQCFHWIISHQPPAALQFPALQAKHAGYNGR